MSSIMRWRNGLMALSVMAIAPVSHEVTNPAILRQDEPTCYPAIQHASRTLRRGGAYRERFSPWADSGPPMVARERQLPAPSRRSGKGLSESSGAADASLANSQK